MTTSVQIKRAYEPYAESDGFRVLVDRLWPRGVSKATLHHDMWCKEIAPSTTLRNWFGHKPERWEGFQRDYGAELQSESSQALMGEILAAAGDRPVTLVYSAHDEAHNQAVVLAGELRAYAKRHRL